MNVQRKPQDRLLPYGMSSSWKSHLLKHCPALFRHSFRWLGHGSLALLMLGGASAYANPVLPDGSTQTQITGSFDCSSDCLITGSDRQGGNLFHSFTQFSIPEAVTITFDGPNLTNILTRVTGGQASDLRGRLAVQGGANFYLLNPNGILFYPTSGLQLQGSFVGTTATFLEFADGSRFSAAAAPSVQPPLLTVSTPIGLTLGSNASPIQVQGALLPGPPPTLTLGQTFALIGGDVSIQGSQLFSLDGNIIIQSAGAGSNVALLSTPQGLEVSADVAESSHDVRIEQSQLLVRGLNGGGSIQVQGRNVTLSASALRNDAFPSATQDSSGIRLQAQEQLLIEAGTELRTEATELSRGGDITFEADLLAIAGSTDPTSPFPTIIAAEAPAAGDSGELLLQAQTIDIQDFSLLGTETTGSGQAGDIRIRAEDFLLTGSRIVSRTVDGGGSAGSITLQAANRAQLDGVVPFVGIPAGLATDTVGSRTSGSLAGGSIVVDVGSTPLQSGQVGDGELRVQNGAQLSASTFGSGIAGDVIVQAGNIALANTFISPGDGQLFSSGIFSQVESGATGQGGNIQVAANALSLEDGAQISSSTFDQGNAGEINIDVAQAVTIAGQDSGLFAQVEFKAPGEGGDIRLRTPSLSLRDDGKISATTAGFGTGGNVTAELDSLTVDSGGQLQVATLGNAPAGNLDITAQGTVSLSGISAVDQAPSGLVSSTGLQAFTDGNQSAGSIRLQAQNLNILDGARISASSFNQGAGGVIDVSIANKAHLRGTAQDIQPGSGQLSDRSSSGLFAIATGEGQAGDIRLETGSLVLDEQATLLAETLSNNGGNIQLSARDSVLMSQGSLISATAGQGSGAGNGGNIFIQTPLLVAPLMQDSDIVANAFQGAGGQIQIATQVLLGLEPRPAIAGNGTNDIDASSEAGTNGTVEIRRLVDSDKIITTEINNEPSNASQLIGHACDNPQQFGGQFVVTGRGGLPLSPSDGSGLWVPLLDEPFSSGWAQTQHPSQEISAANGMEAQGWQLTRTGGVQLVGHSSSYRPEHRFVPC